MQSITFTKSQFIPTQPVTMASAAWNIADKGDLICSVKLQVLQYILQQLFWQVAAGAAEHKQ